MRDADSGEWLWRPLINPEVLTQDFFEVGELSGFGLLQRDREFTSYQDLEAHYHRRPSAWVTPVGRWGAGRVVLTQLPTPDETHDNIVAFWQPASLPEQGEYRFAYTLAIGAGDLARHELGQVRHTLVGDGNRIGGGNVEGALRLLVDFSGPALRQLAPTAAVTGQVTALEGSELVEQFVQYNAPCGCWRPSMLVRPGPSGELAVRAYLRHGNDSLTETWSYRLPPGQRRPGAGHRDDDRRRTGTRPDSELHRGRWRGADSGAGVRGAGPGLRRAARRPRCPAALAADRAGPARRPAGARAAHPAAPAARQHRLPAGVLKWPLARGGVGPGCGAGCSCCSCWLRRCWPCTCWRGPCPGRAGRRWSGG